ncbi:hypothetical protein BKA56DRAFT_613944 [Ilyonectria sp. MPI-CAGE-AT-0026]|nr:hypothetical protein BKA56DRAFT_613944 [Ilyonectria sp. MPI-CAGE-AT-0026]
MAIPIHSDPEVLILGAGQAGLTIAARLKALGIDSLMVNKNDRVGDNWRNRYHQLVLHDPVWYDHLPYIRFPPQWPIFTPKDKLADFFTLYATLLELNVWMKSEITSSKWDAGERRWSVTVKRRTEGGVEETRMFRPRHIVQATGHSGKMHLPDLNGIEDFKGHLIYLALVLFPQRLLLKSDLKAFTEKMAWTSIMQISSSTGRHDVELLKRLIKAGFKLDSSPDNAGFFIKYFERGGGYYIDVGASRLIIDGKIKIKQGQEVDRVLPNGLRFADSSELEADEIVLATGYQNMRTQTRIIFGDEVADAVGDIWGFNEEGEMRMIWQRTGHPGFWFHGGNLVLCRYFSKFLALQIKGLEEGVYKYEDS